MAELTEEQKIIIGVSVGVAGLIMIAIIVFICCIFYVKEQRRRRNGYKDNLIVDRFDRFDRYPNVYEKEVPPVMYDPPAPPPPPPPPPAPVRTIWREPMYYKRPRSIEPPYKFDSWDRYSEPPRRYRESRWDSNYRNDPIVVSMAEPEYVSSGVARREPETIYLKYVDDQALLARTNRARRSDYGDYYGGGLRRSRSFQDLRRNRGGGAYMGEWATRPENPSQFNERAYRYGRDPFLWK